MSAMSELALEVETLYFTEGLYPEEIAALTGLSIEEITEYVADMESEYDADPGDMDGDHESALASAGWGTDEDYGCFDSGDW